MLKAIGVADQVAEDIRFDEYVPFKIRFGHRPDAPLFWRALDGNRGLLEIGISTPTGAVWSVNLTAVSSEKIRQVVSHEATSQVQPGVPIVDISAWPTNAAVVFSDAFIDTQCDISLDLGLSYCDVWLGAKDRIVRSIAAGNVTFGIDWADRIRLFRVAVTPSDHETVKRAIGMPDR